MKNGCDVAIVRRLPYDVGTGNLRRSIPPATSLQPNPLAPLPYEIRLEQSVGKPVAIVHRRVARSQLGAAVQQACGVVWNAVRAQQVAGAGRHVAVYWDDVINLDVGVELETPWAGHGEVVSATLPVGLTATTTHFGPYGQLGAAHQAIHDWCRANGHAMAGPNWEIYGHWEDAWNRDASLIRTDVFYLLATSGANGQ